ncbi:phage tail tip lysozyme [Agrobacterium sp. DKPNP3]|uniref:phage tail tip lysozyme n=1 Tax=Agrobacterium sp. DKPNP3 TaxID=3457323 RepID=UPI004043D1EE
MAPRLNNNAYYSYNYLRKNYGLNDHQAAGIVGNLMAESSFNTRARNRGDGRDGSDSIGIGQWNGDRARNLHSFAANRGTTVDNLDTQLDFYMHEANGSERRAGDMIRNAQDVKAATTGAIAYERPAGFSWDNPTGGHNYALRLSYANEVMGNPNPDATAPTQVASAEPAQAPASAEKGPMFPGLTNAMTSMGEAIGITGSGKDGDPVKFMGMELEGDNGLQSHLTGLAKAFGGDEQQQAAPVVMGSGSNAPVQVSFDIASSVPSVEDEKRKRIGGLGGFGGFTSRRV